MKSHLLENEHKQEDNKIILKKFSLSWCLADIALIIVLILTLWLMVALLSFNPTDAGWSQTAWHEVVHNLTGVAGAWTADILFSTWGVVAYSLPVSMILLCHSIVRQSNHEYINCFSLALKLTGLLALLFSSCVLAALHVNDFYYFASGGIIGSLTSHIMLHWFQGIEMTLVMLAIWAAGFTLFTGWSWLLIAEKTGEQVSDLISIIRRYLNPHHDIKDNDHDNRIENPHDTTVWMPHLTHRPHKDDVFFNDIQFDDVLFSAPAITEVVLDKASEPVTDTIATINKLQENLQCDPPFCMTVPVVTTTAVDTQHDQHEDITVKTDEPVLRPANAIMDMDTLIHPFLVRHNQPLQKVTTALPGLDLLAVPPTEIKPPDKAILEETARLIETRLADYRIKARVVGMYPGPVITRFELDLAPGVKAARISSLSRDLARSLSTSAVLVVEVIPGKPWVGLELPNRNRQTVYLREVLGCAKFRDTVSPLAVVLGKDIAGQPVVADLARMPHLLVAGTTGSGKSVGINAMILSMLYKATPDDVRFIMIDPKMLELSVYEGIPHLLTEVVTDMKEAANALRWCVAEMERRYKLMSELGVRNLASYNDRITQAQMMDCPIPDPFWKPADSMAETRPMLEKLPLIVVMVDEFADMMMTVGKKVEELIARLAQKARAAGIHLILATQRPSVDVITGLIKANIPSRIAFTVSSKIDSRTILDQGGAESLLGMGDMLYMAPGASIPIRIHGAFVQDHEVHAVVNDWRARGKPHYIDSILNGNIDAGSGLENDEALDPLFDQAVAFVLEKRRASISGVQRQFRIGYNRAARIIEQMEMQQIVSAQGHNGNREVLAQ